MRYYSAPIVKTNIRHNQVGQQQIIVSTFSGEEPEMMSSTLLPRPALPCSLVSVVPADPRPLETCNSSCFFNELSMANRLAGLFQHLSLLPSPESFGGFSGIKRKKKKKGKSLLPPKAKSLRGKRNKRVERSHRGSRTWFYGKVHVPLVEKKSGGLKTAPIIFGSCPSSRSTVFISCVLLS